MNVPKPDYEECPECGRYSKEIVTVKPIARGFDSISSFLFGQNTKRICRNCVEIQRD